MTRLPNKLQKKIEERKANNALRSLGVSNDLIDFSSNDYLGLSRSEALFESASKILEQHSGKRNGATGSRLLSGNFELYGIAESYISKFHNSEEALIFNSGYDANVGVFSAIPQRGDIILYDALCHASIRDGIALSAAKGYKFHHNDLEQLKELGELQKKHAAEVYVVTESVFSMDGDSPDLESLVSFCTENGYHLIVDEAHALGVLGPKGAGLIQELALEGEVFARIVTFGKALGTHGAAVLVSSEVKEYLINFCRSFIYTTALPPHSVASILAGYEMISKGLTEIQMIHRNIDILQLKVSANNLSNLFIFSASAIHCCIVPGNSAVKALSQSLRSEGFDVKPILSPTVEAGKERLRICLHSYNTAEEIELLIEQLAIFAG